MILKLKTFYYTEKGGPFGNISIANMMLLTALLFGSLC